MKVRILAQTGILIEALDSLDKSLWRNSDLARQLFNRRRLEENLSVLLGQHPVWNTVNRRPHRMSPHETTVE